VRLVVPGLSLCSVLVVLLVVGVALWPGALRLQAQGQEKVSQPVPPPPAVFAPGIGTPSQRALPTPTAPEPPRVAAPVDEALPPGVAEPPPPMPSGRPSKAKAIRQIITAMPVLRTADIPQPQRFKFTIDPKTPLKDLLPIPPGVEDRPNALLTEDLARVPEVMLQQSLSRDLAPQKAQEKTALAIARINHLNKTKSDHFLEALLETRSDLAGLPVAMGDSCRTTGERSKEFARAVATVRQALQNQQVITRVVPQPQPGGPPLMVTTQEVRTDDLKAFWERYNRDA